MNYFKSLIFFVMTSSMLWTIPVLAISTTPSPSPSTFNLQPSTTPSLATKSAKLLASPEADLRQLREKIASKAAQLRKKEAQIIAGEVTKITDTEIKIETPFGTQETLQLDDTLTKYFKFTGSSREDIQKKEITPGTYVLAAGPRTEGKIAVNEVYKDEIFHMQAGRVVEVNTTGPTIKLDTFDKSSTLVTVDPKTTILSLNVKTVVSAVSTFAKIKEGDVVHVVHRLTSLKQKTDQVTSISILHIPAEYFNK